MAVELVGVRDTVLATGISTQNGTFVLEAPAGGTYRVRLTAPGAEAFVSDSVKVADDEYVARAFAIDPEPRDFFHFQVDRPVVFAGGSPVKYPDDLRSNYVSGCVLVRFVVDTTGRADMSTFRILKVSHTKFAEAVRKGLPGMRFRPAELHGRKVRQVVEEPFDSSIYVKTQIPLELGSVDNRLPLSLPLSPAMPPPLPAICAKHER